MDIKTAQTVAQNFERKSRGVSKMVSDVVTEQFEGQNSFYVVNFREGGWVMVSAESSTVPVLAYSEGDTYSSEDERPDGFLYLVEDYKLQIDASRRMGSIRNDRITECGINC